MAGERRWTHPLHHCHFTRAVSIWSAPDSFHLERTSKHAEWEGNYKLIVHVACSVACSVMKDIFCRERSEKQKRRHSSSHHRHSSSSSDSDGESSSDDSISTEASTSGEQLTGLKSPSPRLQ